MREVSGFLNIDKPIGITSHDVVARLRRTLKLQKVGHAGTLDPLATGVLVICVGSATRLSEYVMASTKRYRAQIRLGVVTDTYDAEGTVVTVRDASSVQYRAVETQLANFVGDLQQLPPMYSAVKQGGRKLYDLARSGETVAREERDIRIDSLTLVDYSPPLITLDVVCSAGTYIRSLAYDLGEALGVGAHLSGLIRLASGRFQVENALNLEALLVQDDWQRQLITPQAALLDWPGITLSDEEVNEVRYGRSIQQRGDSDHLTFGYTADGQLLTILRPENGMWRPHKVFLD